MNRRRRPAKINGETHQKTILAIFCSWLVRFGIVMENTPLILPSTPSRLSHEAHLIPVSKICGCGASYGYGALAEVGFAQKGVDKHRMAVAGGFGRLLKYIICPFRIIEQKAPGIQGIGNLMIIVIS